MLSLAQEPRVEVLCVFGNLIEQGLLVGQPHVLEGVQLAARHPSVRRIEVLVRVDLDPLVTELILEEDGYATVSVSDGLGALNACRAKRPDVLLLDVSMPGELTGLEVCRRIRADEDLHTVRVMLLTARAREQGSPCCAWRRPALRRRAATT